MNVPQFAQQPAAPAGGAALDEIMIAFGIAVAVGVPVAWFIWRELTGKRTVIGRVADWLAEKDGMPRWVSLPTYGAMAAIILAGFGVWWDVPIHMQDGRDEGPLANPSHYPIYFALLAIFALGVISATLAYNQPMPRRTFPILGRWRVPLGSMIMIAAGVIAVAGFPADDLWHRLFGQDVTEWGPTHVMMIGGAVTAPLAFPLLQAEAAQLGARRAGLWGRIRDTIHIGFCLAPFAFLMEFDLGVPQFPAATQFVIVGFLTGWIFVTARRYFGPGGALIAWGFYAVAHAFLFLSVAAIPGVLNARFLLFLPAVILIELAALIVKPKRGYAFGAVAGLAAGSLGLLAEWWWSQLFMPLPQPLPASSLPLMITVGTIAGLGGGLLGVWHYQQLERTGGYQDDTLEFSGIEATLRRFKLGSLVGIGEKVFGIWHREMRERTGPLPPAADRLLARHGWGLAGMLTFIVLMAAFAPPSEQQGVSGAFEFSKTCDGEQFGCFSTMTVTLDPVDSADDAVWIYALAYQGRRGHAPGTAPGEGVLTTRMVPTGRPGQFASERPVPMYGQWKTAVRIHLAPTTMMAAFVHAPEDPEITSPKGRQVVVGSGDRVEFTYEPDWLQRERKEGVPEWLWTAAYTAVGLTWLALIGFYGWCYARAAGSGRRPVQTPQPPGRVPAR